MRKKRSFYVLWAVIIFFVVTSCRKESQLITSASAKIAFSADTLMFDTVFTTVGSATQNFLIYNNHSQPINISSIRLAGGASSYFRLNVDGAPGKSFTNIQIGPKDSLWVFVEVTINPNNTTTPFIIGDSILFMTNGNLQWVDLVAFGQNAHFHKPPPNTGSAFFVKCGDEWKNDLPNVVYGYALVDSACTLTIDQGAKVYFHPGSGLVVLSSGTLLVNGVKDAPVSFLNDRLGVAYSQIPGQWDRIWISNLTHSYITSGNTYIGPAAKNCVINYAIIQNGNIGIEADTVYDGNPNTVTLQLDNTIIENEAGEALLGQGATIRCTNSIFANCGQYVAALAYGGNYDFRHCTFANYWSSSSRTTPSVYINNYFVSGVTTYVRPIQQAYFGNCIIYGNLMGEIGLDSAKIGGSHFNFMFDHSLINISDTISTSNPAHYTSVITTEDPMFTDPTNNNYIQPSRMQRRLFFWIYSATTVFKALHLIWGLMS
jgi:hypothetical protein